MWFKVENKRSSIGQKFVVRCNSEISGRTVVEERSVKGTAATRKTAEILATSLNVTTTVYGTDGDGEFVHGVYEIADGAADAASPIIKKLFAESVSASLAFKDQLLADIPEDTIKGFAAMSAALGYVVTQHKQIKRAATPQASYPTLFRIFCDGSEPSTISLPADDANVDGELQVIRPRTVFRGTVPESDGHFMLVVQRDHRSGELRDSIGLIYRELDEAAVISLVRKLLQESNPFKGRIVLVNRDLRTVRSRMSERSWKDIIPHQQARAELDFLTASIRNRDMLKAEGLSMKRGLLLSGPPGDGKSTAIECFVNDIAGEATVIIVEAVDHIRAVYHLAQMLSPALVILEDLDLITKGRQNPYS